MRVIEFPKFLVFEVNESNSTPLTTFIRIYERKTLDHGVGPRVGGDPNQSFDSNATGPTSAGGAFSENYLLPALAYAQLDGYFCASSDTEGKVKIDQAAIQRTSVREVITGINLFVSCKASL